MNFKNFSAAALMCAALSLGLPSLAVGAGMADAHQRAGLQCTVCHAKQGVAPAEATCTGCHNPADLQKKTAKMMPTNPHVSPHYELTCTNCHKGHQQSVDFCAQCHKFGFKVP